MTGGQFVLVGRTGKIWSPVSHGSETFRAVPEKSRLWKRHTILSEMIPRDLLKRNNISQVAVR